MPPKKPLPKPAARKKTLRRTNNDLYSVLLGLKDDLIETKAGIVDVKADVVTVKESVLSLTGHVNHEVELLQADFTARINGKLDNDQLLKSLGFHMLNNRWFRWSFGFGSTSILLGLAYAQWSGPIGVVARFILRAATGTNIP